jgi:hypothetical protein
MRRIPVAQATRRGRYAKNVKCLFAKPAGVTLAAMGQHDNLPGKRRFQSIGPLKAGQRRPRLIEGDSGNDQRLWVELNIGGNERDNG